MPPIDPQKLLKALDPLLTSAGGLAGAQEASRIASLMKDANKLVSRCIYLNILRVTESKDALEKFIEVGGWDILNNWLEMAKNDGNDPLLGELLEVYLVFPVTVGLLKQNSAAKTIKQLSKSETEKIKNMSTTLVDRWKKIISGQTNGTDNDDEKRKKKKHKDKDKEKNEKDKENDKKERQEKDSEKHRSRDKDSKDHHHHHHRDSREKDREKDKDRDKDRKDRDRHKDKERDKDRDKSKRDKSKSSSDNKDSKDSSSSKHHTSSSSTSSSSSSVTTPSDSSSSKTKDSTSASKRTSLDDVKPPTSSSTTPSSTTSKDQDASKEEESRKRPKTVKQIGTKFRSTGLFDEEEEEIEPVKKKIDKIPIKRVGIDIKPEELSEKKPRLHLTMPTLTPANVDAASTTPPEVTHGKIKLIPPKKPPAHEIQESNVFMDALQQSTYSAGIKKKKKLVSPSTTGAPNLLRGGSATSPPPASSPPSATSPPPSSHGNESGPTSPPLLSPTTVMAQKLPSVPSFYRDTLEDMPESTSDNKKSEDNDNASPPPLEIMGMNDAEKDEGEQDMDTGAGAEDNAGDADAEQKPAAPRKPKKSVSWARDAQLEEVFYFEMDETERENVNRPKTFNEMKKEEMLLDRRAMETVKRFNNDTMVEVLQWKTPKPVDNVICLVESGSSSVERKVQMEREQVVLCALFFNKIPDTPSEPDPDLSNEKADTKIIPLEDENGSCTEYEHTYNFSDPTSLPYDPEFGGLPLQSQGPSMNQGGGAGGNNNMGGGFMNNMANMNNSTGNNRGHMNIPPPISHILNTLQQQAQETRDPIMQNLQGMLTNVLQSTNPQDSGMLMERILGALEPFKNQIPGLTNLINSVTGSGMDSNMGGPGGPRFMGPGPGQMGGNPRHGLLGSAPPGFNMMGGGGGNMRPGMQGRSGPGHMMGNGGGGMGGNPNYYMGGGGSGGGNMRMGGPNWRGGRSRPYGKRGKAGSRNVVCQYFVKTGTCKYGDGCQFIHPNS